jgi:4-amino-4-deoxy-L-arabinose transferase-like glycosyltransferase
MKNTFFIFILALTCFLAGLNGQEIISFDSRFYVFAKEMWVNGPSLFPTTYGVPYPDYPVTSTLLIYLSAWLCGGLSKFSAVLPSALAAALTVVVTEKIAALQSRKTGWFAVCMLLSTFAFLKSARSIALDMYPVLITTSCFYLVHAAQGRQESASVKWIYPLFVLGFVFRGPIGLVMPTGVVCVYYLLQNKWKQLFATGVIAVLLLVLCMTVLLLLAYVSGGVAFMHDVIRMQMSGRFSDKPIPVGFYFTDSFLSYALSYPFAFMIMAVVLVKFIVRKGNMITLSDNERFLLQLSGWVIVIMLGMSIPGDKKVRYVLPMAPALALLSAALWHEISGEKYLKWLRRIIMSVYALLPSALFCATIYCMHIANQHGLTNAAPFMAMTIFFGAMQLFMLALRRSSAVLYIGTLCFVAANIFLLDPISEKLDSARDFVLSAESIRASQNAKLVFYKLRADGLAIKYMVNVPDASVPIFIKTKDDLSLVKAPVVIIAEQEYFSKLPTPLQRHYTVVVSGKIGHVQVVAMVPK